MLLKVGEELTPFIALFFGFVIAFAFVLVALDLHKDKLAEDDVDPYEGLGGFGFALYVLRTSFGDFSVDPFKYMGEGLRAAMWIFWLVVIFCNTIIFLNFIIAEVSSSYDRVNR